MRLIILLITIFFSSCLHAKDLFGFVVSVGHGETYNSFNETYSRVLCEKGDRTIHNSKIRLNTKNMEKIQTSLESMEFWYMETDELVSYGANEVVTAIAPCDQKTLFAQKNNDINYVWASCGSLPKRKIKQGEHFLELIKQIRSYIKDNEEYKNIPKSTCGVF